MRKWYYLVTTTAEASEEKNVMFMTAQSVAILKQLTKCGPDRAHAFLTVLGILLDGAFVRAK